MNATSNNANNEPTMIDDPPMSTSNVVQRKIEKYIDYFKTQPRTPGYSNSVKSDLERLRQYSLISASDTQSQWITK